VRLRRERVAWLLLADLSYEVTYQPVVMADFIVPLAYMTMASWLFAEAGIISPKKQFRLMVSESFQTETLMLHTFTGDISTPFFGYYYGDTPPDNKPYLESIFSAALKRQPLPKE
jgi:hypothetical protein